MSQFIHISHKPGILSLFIILIFKVLRPALKSETIDLRADFSPFFLYTGFLTAHTPAPTAQYSAMAMTKIKQLSFLGERSWLCVRFEAAGLKVIFYDPSPDPKSAYHFSGRWTTALARTKASLEKDPMTVRASTNSLPKKRRKQFSLIVHQNSLSND